MVGWRRERLGKLAIASIFLLTLSTHYQLQRTGEEEKLLSCVKLQHADITDISHIDVEELLEDLELPLFQSDSP